MLVVQTPNYRKVKLNKQFISPSKVVCVGRNYAKHIAELNNETPAEPVIFVKPNSAVTEQLVLSKVDDIHYEAELCFMVVDNAIVAVAAGLDLTKRDVQSQLKSTGLPWEKAKAFDGSALFSEFVAVPSDIPELEVKLYINEQVRQQGAVSHMIFKPHILLEHVLSFMTLYNGDIIMSGTPSGVGKLHDGDKVDVQVAQNGQPIVSEQWTAITQQ